MENRVRTSLLYVALIWSGIVLFARPVQADTITLTADLNASQVVAGSTSTATGFATVTIDATLFTITTDLSWSGLSGPADRAHLHDAPAGQTSLPVPSDHFFREVLSDMSVPFSGQVPCGFISQGVITNCAPPTGTAHDVLQLNAGNGGGELKGSFGNFAALVDAFVHDGIYIDMHTERYPLGEIRGQLRETRVPEPGSLAMLTAGFLGLGLLRHCIGTRRSFHPN